MKSILELISLQGTPVGGFRSAKREPHRPLGPTRVPVADLWRQQTENQEVDHGGIILSGVAPASHRESSMRRSRGKERTERDATSPAYHSSTASHRKLIARHGGTARIWRLLNDRLPARFMTSASPCRRARARGGH